MNSISHTLHMTRCDYDVIFYRVFCITLLAVAFTFTVILTNVFVDIDGLLVNKEKDKSKDASVTENPMIDHNALIIYKEDKNYDEGEDTYRTKRSLESQNMIYQIKNAKFKNILTNRLATLLEELETEETTTQGFKNEQKPDENNFKAEIETFNDKNKEVMNTVKTKSNIKEQENSKDILHLAIHNILLQGIIKHGDLNEIYKKVQTMTTKLINDKEFQRKPEALIPTNEINEENIIFNEMVTCKTLQKEIKDAEDIKLKSTINSRKSNIRNDQDKKVFINTVIDITSNDKSRKENDTESRDNIKGIIKLIYNGKSVKINRADEDEDKTLKNIKSSEVVKSNIEADRANMLMNNYKPNMPKSYLNFMTEYFKKYSNKNDNLESIQEYEGKRLKRHIKIRYNRDTTTPKNNIRNKKNFKSDEDELYVEIETHFDSKGIKGERKKKLVRGLIDKIQSAIHSDIEKFQDGDKNKIKHLKIKKRVQNPFDRNNKNILLNKIIIPSDLKFHRHLDPISKSVRMDEKLPLVTDKKGEHWQKSYLGPSFLTVSKSINSAEMSEVNTEYNKIIDMNGISQRLQKPLNTDADELPSDAYYDMGNINFLLKDIDGSGFSVGFNQYTGEPPDSDSMKLFTGVENIINTYHQNYDSISNNETTDNNLNTVQINNLNEEEYDMDNKTHYVLRRSVKEDKNNNDYHSNEYKIIFDSNFLPYHNYQEIYNKKQKINQPLYKELKNHDNINPSNLEKELPLLINNNILDKNLKPSEIFSLANLFKRKKRSMTVKKYTNLKTKIKLNRFLNTKPMTRKKFYIKNKRNKRQIDKIRIIATDNIHHRHKHSDENFFLVSNENMLSDRAVVRENHAQDTMKNLETEDGEDIQDEINNEHVISPDENEQPNIQIPYLNSLFNEKSRHNTLMSKYPHIFMEEIGRSKEEEFVPDPSIVTRILETGHRLNSEPLTLNTEASTSNVISDQNFQPAKVEDIVNAIAPPVPKSNYKLTVKITPKNNTNLNSGFKEIHTSINKSFNRNGMQYVSLLNVSEISKIEKLNKSSDPSYVTSHPIAIHNIKDQQKDMKILLRQHKDRIEYQLNKLKSERDKVETMIKKDRDDQEIIDVVLPMDPPQVLHLSKIEIGKLVSSALVKLERTIAPIVTEEPTTSTTTESILETTVDFEKSRLMHTIDRNENLTNEILKKIDTSNQMLQQFLQKLLDKPIVRQEISIPSQTRAENFGLQQIHDPFFDKTMPNLEANKNNTHLSIPFVYAYQQPFVLPNKPQTPVASVVYQGHIHTNAIQQKKPIFWNPDTNLKEHSKHLKRDVNKTKFFIDDLGNDYKITSKDTDNITTNTTMK